MGEPLVEMRPSGWAGQGLFARQPLRAGQFILEYLGEKISKADSARRRAAHNNYIFRLDYAWDVDGQSPDNLARYLNHSCEPNCEVENTGGRLLIKALRDIEAGEELSFNYGFDATDYERFPCHCGAPSCCGYILAREQWGQIPPNWSYLREDGDSAEPERQPHV